MDNKEYGCDGGIIMYEALEGLEKKYKITEFPLNVAIEITNHCNLNCIMCGNDK